MFDESAEVGDSVLMMVMIVKILNVACGWPVLANVSFCFS
jgi:hypothetical protein